MAPYVESVGDDAHLKVKRVNPRDPTKEGPALQLFGGDNHDTPLSPAFSSYKGLAQWCFENPGVTKITDSLGMWKCRIRHMTPGARPFTSPIPPRSK